MKWSIVFNNETERGIKKLGPVISDSSDSEEEGTTSGRTCARPTDV